jgi:hypothetical protein
MMRVLRAVALTIIIAITVGEAALAGWWVWQGYIWQAAGLLLAFSVGVAITGASLGMKPDDAARIVRQIGGKQ